MKPATRFLMNAYLGFAAVILLLVIGMVISVRRLGEINDSQIARIREEEYQITLAERLRGFGAQIAAAARGYVITGNPDLLTMMHNAEAEFDQTVKTMKTTKLTTEEMRFMVEVEQSATDYRRVQQALVPQAANQNAVKQWLQTEVLPRQLVFARTLDRFVAHEQDEIQNTYVQARNDRNEVTAWIYGMLGILFLASLAVAGYVTRLLARSYRATDKALAISRRALAGRDELIGIVAHDLRNPLAAITLRTMAIRQRDMPDPVRRQVEAVENIAMRAEYIIKTMLDVSEIEEGRFAISPTHCNVDKIVDNAVAMVENVAASKQLQIKSMVTPVSLAVRADQERVLEVLSNLIDNAIKVAPPGSTITIDVTREDDRVRFTVSDAGPAIPSELLSHMFARFWEGPVRDRNRTRVSLFSAKAIVEAHGGTIRADSAERGASFTFTLPADATAATEPVAGAQVRA